MRAKVYDALITRMTSAWYAAVIERLPPGTHVLDIGIGTGSALLDHADAIRAKDLRFTGVDIDAPYIDACCRAVEDLGLTDRITAHVESIYDHRGGPYDAAYFSGSFMLLPDPAGALRHVGRLLQQDAPIYFTQTFEHQPSPLLERLKPLLKFLTTVDFGAVTYETDFDATLEAAGFRASERVVLEHGSRRSPVLVTAFQDEGAATHHRRPL